jgi:hypothetical protein
MGSDTSSFILPACYGESLVTSEQAHEWATCDARRYVAIR